MLHRFRATKTVISYGFAQFYSGLLPTLIAQGNAQFPGL